MLLTFHDASRFVERIIANVPGSADSLPRRSLGVGGSCSHGAGTAPPPCLAKRPVAAFPPISLHEPSKCLALGMVGTVRRTVRRALAPRSVVAAGPRHGRTMKKALASWPHAEAAVSAKHALPSLRMRLMKAIRWRDAGEVHDPFANWHSHCMDGSLKCPKDIAHGGLAATGVKEVCHCSEKLVT